MSFSSIISRYPYHINILINTYWPSQHQYPKSLCFQGNGRGSHRPSPFLKHQHKYSFILKSGVSVQHFYSWRAHSVKFTTKNYIETTAHKIRLKFKYPTIKSKNFYVQFKDPPPRMLLLIKTLLTSIWILLGLLLSQYFW